MRIGLYSGTFDPIHVGHLIIMENSINQMNLDKIIVIPSANPPHKLDKKKTPANIRVEMVKEAIKDNEKLVLSTYESTDSLVKYTYETLDFFEKSFPNDEVFLIIGEDSFLSLNTWKNYEKILKSKLIVFAREESKSGGVLEREIESQRKLNPNIYLLNDFFTNISSTLVRNLVNENKSIKYLVSDEVMYIIKNRGLYVWFWKL